MKAVFSTFCIVFFTRAYILAQLSITSLSVEPVLPLPNDEIKIKTITQATGDGDEVSYEYTIENDTIRIIGCYTAGLGASAPTHYKTTNLGILSQGDYTVIYNLTRAQYPDYVCNFIDADTIHFTISPENAHISITSFSIEPISNPISTDDIIINTVTKSNADGYEHSYEYILENDTIWIMGCYFISTETTNPSYTKAVDVGVLPEGNYTAIYNAQAKTVSIDSCVSKDVDTLYFTISAPTNVIENLVNNRIKLFPNPSNQYVNILLNEVEATNVYFIDISGQIVYSSELKKSKNILDIDKLDNGIYFVKILNDNIVIGVNKFVKQ